MDESCYTVFYYTSDELVNEHKVKVQHVSFVFDKLHCPLRSDRIELYGDDCAKFCWYMQKLAYKYLCYISRSFYEQIQKAYKENKRVSVDIIKFAFVTELL